MIIGMWLDGNDDFDDKLCIQLAERQLNCDIITEKRSFFKYIQEKSKCY